MRFAPWLLAVHSYYKKGRRQSKMQPTLKKDYFVRPLPLLVGAASLSGLIACALVPAGEAVPLHLQSGMLFGGLAAVIYAFSTGEPPLRIGSIKVAVLAIVPITLFGLAIRALGLDELRVLIDEGNSIDAWMATAAPSRLALVEAPSIYVTTLLYPYLQGIGIELFGHDLIGLRMANAWIGAATVPAVYLLGRMLVNGQIGWMAALLFATFPPHLHFSRIALPHVIDVLFGTYALAFLARALRFKGRRDWAMAGAALGLSHYGFEAGRLFYTPLALLWLALVAHRQFAGQRDGIIAGATAFVAAIAPAYAVAWSKGAAILPRWHTSSLTIEDTGEWLTQVAARIWPALRVYVTEPDSWPFYGGEEAMVLPWLAPLFVCGAIALISPRRPFALVPLWLAAAVIANAALRDSTVYPRWVVVFPAIALALAAGIRMALALLFGRRAPWAIAPLAVVVTGAAAAGQLQYYFDRHVPALAVQALRIKPYRDAIDAVLRTVAELPPRTVILIASDPPVDIHPPRQLLALLDADRQRRFEVVRTGELNESVFETIPADFTLALFVEPNDERAVAIARRYYDLSEPQHSPYPIPPDKELVLYRGSALARP
ncbi:MAG TPA: glycosyltransferase family 39 protein [Terriglobales bacterium]|nr:glycosyltransferase family 39 protein [Terriglobales bacterium]